MSKGFMPNMLLIPNGSLKKFERCLNNKEDRKAIFKNVAISQLKVEQSKWIFLHNSNISILNEHMFPFSLKVELDSDELTEKRSHVDDLFRGLLESVFEESNYDFNTFNQADQATLVRFMNIISLQLSIRYENVIDDKEISYLQNETTVTDAINDMIDNLVVSNDPKPIKSLVSAVDAIPIADSVEEFIQDFYDRYDHKLCSFTFENIFRLSYTTDMLFFNSRIEGKSLKDNNLVKILTLIGNITGVSIFEPESESLIELKEFTSTPKDTSVIKRMFTRLIDRLLNDEDPVALRKEARSLFEDITGNKLDDSLFDEDGKIKSLDGFLEIVAETFGPEEAASFLEDMGVGVKKVEIRSPKDIEDVLATLKDQMSPEDFERLKSRLDEFDGYFDDSEDESKPFVDQQPKYLN